MSGNTFSGIILYGSNILLCGIGGVTIVGALKAERPKSNPDMVRGADSLVARDDI